MPNVVSVTYTTLFTKNGSNYNIHTHMLMQFPFNSIILKSVIVD